MKKVKILGIVGSIRSNYKHIDQLKEIINVAENQKDLNDKIKTSGLFYSNSDVAIAHSLLAARLDGALIDIASITNIFSHRKMGIYSDFLKYKSVDDINDIDSLSIDEKKMLMLLKKVDENDGIILGTPVYFGDRSSIANKFLQLTSKHNSLKHKAFGVVSTGAKRNGGQETANIYSLFEALVQGAIVTGNGPKTSQYGGTVWAGDVGVAVNDDFGLETCFGVGKQVANLADIISAGLDNTSSRKSKITFIVTMDTNSKKYEEIVRQYAKKVDADLDVEIINLTDFDIYRCIACDVCPSPALYEKLKHTSNPYHCIIQTKKDGMNIIQDKLVGSQCIVLVGVNSNDELTYRYQAFMERTRFIRHDDFQLTNIPIVSLQISELGAVANSIFNLKVLTSFIRHNTFFIKPLEIILKNGVTIHESKLDELNILIPIINQGRKSIKPLSVSYKATGYSNIELDYTTKSRT